MLNAGEPAQKQCIASTTVGYEAAARTPRCVRVTQTHTYDITMHDVTKRYHLLFTLAGVEKTRETKHLVNLWQVIGLPVELVNSH